jgi:ABC-2 type transport system ATP-binding protein
MLGSKVIKEVVSSDLPLAISVCDLKKSYGWLRRQAVLKGVSFDVTAGSCCGLLGPNGAGKTTLIKSLMGLVRFDKGEVQVLGGDGYSKKIRSRVGFLPEESFLYSFLTIEETMRFSADLYGGGKEVLSRIDPLLELVVLNDFRSRRISQCSKGMRRRVAFAQAMLHDPDLLILDEPTSGFDPVGMAMMKDVIRDLHDQGKTLLICSHQLREVQDLCDDIVILHRGEVLAKGPLSDLVPTDKWMLTFDDELVWSGAKARLEREELPFCEHEHGDLEAFFVRLVEDNSLDP